MRRRQRGDAPLKMSNQIGLVAKCYFEKSWKCLEHDVRIERGDRKSLAIHFGKLLAKFGINHR
jgi:hypothetical protein